MDEAGTARVKQVNENQCHMCMPLGGVAAFKGTENAMVLVHGSQGCSTYMRLTNVEHYNEPVDIASSSLNEKQTIYGGEANLCKAIDNVIRVYQPKVLGIVTTCLAETIGDDVKRIVESYVQKRGTRDIDIIPVSTPSYGGTQTEGFWTAVREEIAYYARATPRHQKINVIIPNITPADIREIKRILGLMGLEYTLIPDYSLTLDRPYGGRYQKIPPGGTKTEDIARMPGAPLTIQFGTTCPDEISPGRYLEQEWDVPLVNLPLPIGLDAMDLFIRALEEIGEKEAPGALSLERGWLCDAMADSHKYNAEGRPAIYGEPELVNGIARLLCENGAGPVIIATGTKTRELAACIETSCRDADEKPILLAEADFAVIAEAVEKADVNIAVGHSGGKLLTERLGIPVVRVGFPIHDRMGGQRILTVGYTGSLAFLDRFTNTLLEQKYATYRKETKERLFTNGGL